MPEMDGWFLQSSRSRSRGRERVRGSRTSAKLDPDRSGTRRTRSEGNNAPGNGVGTEKNAVGPSAGLHSSSQDNVFAHELKQSCSYKGRVPIKALIEEEMSKEFESKRASPSVIARLMGLDALPTPRPVYKSKKESERWSQETVLASLRERNVSCLDYSSTSCREQQEFKDVYEVVERSMINKHQNLPIQKGLSKPNHSEKDFDFIREKFLDAKRLVTDEKLHNSKDFRDTLDILDSNRDLFLKFLQDPNTLFTKHIHDIHSVPSKPQSSHITLLKPSKITNVEKSEINWASDRKIRSHNHFGKETRNCSSKYDSDLISHPIKDRSLFVSPMMPKPKFEGKREDCPLPTRIVVLKPTAKKVQIADNILLPSCTEKSMFGHRRHKEHRMSCSDKLISEVRDRQKVLDTVVLSGHKTNCLQDIPKEISKNRSSLRNVSPNVLVSGVDDCSRSASSQNMHGKCKLLDAGIPKQTLRCFNERDDWYTSSSFHSAESSTCTEARKHLSERWKIASRFQNAGSVAEGSNTLGEMLALSDKETFDIASKNEVYPKFNYPLGISSRDGWKDGYSRKLPRSRSLPASSTSQASSRRRNRAGSFGDGDSLLLKDVLNFSSDKSPEVKVIHQKIMTSQRSVKSSQSNSPQFDSKMGVENELPLHETYMKPTEHLDRTSSTEEVHEFSEPSVAGYYDAMALVDDITTSEIEDVETPFKHNNNDLSVAAVSLEPMGDIGNLNTMKEISVNQSLEESLSNSHVGEPDSMSPLVSDTHAIPPESKDAEQPSPVSVLEPLDDEEKSSPECFERLSAELHGLRLQLQLLKLESKSDGVECSDLSSDEETGEDAAIFPQTSEVLELSTDEDERDFSYLLDMLTDAGVHGATLDTICTSYYLPASPVGPDVFESLEKVYDEPTVWSRSGRKLLFDLINSVLSDLIVPHMDLQPWLKPTRRRAMLLQGEKVLADEVWQLLLRCRKQLMGNPAELILDADWLDVRNIVDIMGRELETMLMDDLLKEVVSELFAGGLPDLSFG